MGIPRVQLFIAALNFSISFFKQRNPDKIGADATKGSLEAIISKHRQEIINYEFLSFSMNIDFDLVSSIFLYL